MRPTVEEVRRAAYDRWERRGWAHGGDRDDWCAAEKELVFQLNYRKIAEFSLEGAGLTILGDGRVHRCRFCERTARPNDFGVPRPVALGRTSLLTAEVCDDCQGDWRDGLDAELRSFWQAMKRGDSRNAGDPQPFGVAALKAMSAAALLLMPHSELRYFVDTLEWVSNPDHEADDRLVAGAGCRVYRATFLGEHPGAALSRRIDEDAPVPYMLFSLECEGIMVEVPLPMCLRDEDLDGREVEHPERVPAAGSGADFREARGVLLPLAISARRISSPARHRALAS